VYYERSQGNSGSRVHLVVQEMTGGAAGRGRCMPEAEPNGRAVLQDLANRNWISPNSAAPGQHRDLADLISSFRELFSDGVIFDTKTLDGATAMRVLDSEVLAGALPAVLASMEDGGDMIMLSNRWLSPVYRRGTLRTLFVLPADPEPERLRTWREVMRAWNTGTEALAAEAIEPGRSPSHG